MITVMCVTGIKDDKYTMFLCNLNGFSLITSVHYYSVSPKTGNSISDGVGILKSTDV